MGKKLSEAQLDAFTWDGWYSVICDEVGVYHWFAWWTAKPNGNPWQPPDASGTAKEHSGACWGGMGAVRDHKGGSASVRQLNSGFAYAALRVSRGKPARYQPHKSMHLNLQEKEQARLEKRRWNAVRYWADLDRAYTHGDRRIPDPKDYGFSKEPEPPEEAAHYAAEWTPEKREEARARHADAARRRQQEEDRIWEDFRRHVEDFGKRWEDFRREWAGVVGQAPDGDAAVRYFGLSMPCTPDDVKRAFRKKVASERLHPDQGGTAESFRAAAEQCAAAVAYVERQNGASAGARA